MYFYVQQLYFCGGQVIVGGDQIEIGIFGGVDYCVFYVYFVYQYVVDGVFWFIFVYVGVVGGVILWINVYQ